MRSMRARSLATHTTQIHGKIGVYNHKRERMNFINRTINKFNEGKNENEKICPIDIKKRAHFEAAFPRKMGEFKELFETFKIDLLRYEFPSSYETVYKKRGNSYVFKMTAIADAETPYSTMLEITSDSNYQTVTISVTSKVGTSSQTFTDFSDELSELDMDLIMHWLQKTLDSALLAR
jgi:hypothetical protein